MRCNLFKDAVTKRGTLKSHFFSNIREIKFRFLTFAFLNGFFDVRKKVHYFRDNDPCNGILIGKRKIDARQTKRYITVSIYSIPESVSVSA